MPYLLISALLVILDQASKFLIRANLDLGEQIVLIPRVVALTYVQNTGAAFSSFPSHTAALAVLSLVVSAALVVAMFRVFHHPAGRWITAVILAGAVGNLIDRAALGFVTDMIQTLFIRFAVFNVADICVVLGVIALVIYVLFFWDRLEAPLAPAGRRERRK